MKELRLDDCCGIPLMFLADNLNVLCAQLSDWLKTASVHQAANPFSRGMFRRESEQRPLVTEIDGTPSKHFFTVLNIGEREGIHYEINKKNIKGNPTILSILMFLIIKTIDANKLVK